MKERKQLALKAFQHVCSYDAAISQYLARVDVEDNTNTTTSTNNNNISTRSKSDPLVIRPYEHQFDLKYGVNPHQIPAAIYSIVSIPQSCRILLYIHSFVYSFVHLFCVLFLRKGKLSPSKF